jgi:hypothetical protein
MTMILTARYMFFGAFSSKLTHVNSGMLYLRRGASEWAVAVLLLVTGVFMGGPANLITGCISGMNAASCVRFTARRHSGPWHHPSLEGNSKALATVAGIIDGTGRSNSRVHASNQH